jgi:glycosyltransferase involved in cell wall biosynthesis
MNILIETIHSPYSGDRVGGAETSLRLIAEGFAERGHKVIFITRQQGNTLCGYSRKIVNGVSVISFNRFSFNLLNSYKFKIITNGVKGYYLKHLLKKQRIDIVHTYYNFFLLKKYTTLKKDFNYKLIIRMAGLKLFEELKNEKHAYRKELYKTYFKAVDQFNFISVGLFELFNLKMDEFNFQFNFENYFIKDIGIRPQVYSSFEKVKPINGVFNIIMVSRLSLYQKRQDVLIEAMFYLRDKNIKLTILGDGPNQANLERRVKKLDLQNSVEFLPFIEGERVWQALSNYDLLVHACDYEGLSKIIIESMGNGLPVLVSNVLPLNKYIINGQNGFLVNNSPEAWAEAIAELSGNQQIFDAIKNNAKKFINEEYNSENNILIYESKFESLINDVQQPEVQ